MKKRNVRSTSAIFCLFPAFLALGCGAGGGEDDSDGDGAPSGDKPIELQEITFDLDGDRMLSSLSDEEIVGACDELASGVVSADEQIACRVVAAGENDDPAACAEAREVCLENPGAVRDSVTISASPAPINCSVFNAELTVGCDYPVSLLLACANALASSVISSGDAVSCQDAASFSSVEEANKAALDNQGVEFVGVCLELESCEALVQALISGGESEGIK